MNKSESIKNIAASMAQFQSEVKQPLKDKDNPFFKSKYVPLESVVEAIMDIAPKHKLSFMQWALNDESGRVGISTIVMHESGEFIEFDPVFMKSDKDTPQGNGALLTYLKRYTLSAIFGITSDEDDDANSVSGNQSSRASGNQAPKSKPAPKPKTSSLTQQSEIERKAKEYIKIQGTGTISALMEFLKISDIKLISENHAKVSIKKLDEIIAAAKKKQEADTLKELQE